MCRANAAAPCAFVNAMLCFMFAGSLQHTEQSCQCFTEMHHNSAKSVSKQSMHSVSVIRVFLLALAVAQHLDIDFHPWGLSINHESLLRCRTPMSLASSRLTTLHAKPQMQQLLAKARSAKQLTQQQITPVTHTCQQRSLLTVVHPMLRMQLQLASRRASKLPMMLPSMLKTLPAVPVRKASKQLGQHNSTLRRQLTLQAGQASKQLDQLSRVTTRQLMLPAKTFMMLASHAMVAAWLCKLSSKVVADEYSTCHDIIVVWTSIRM